MKKVSVLVTGAGGFIGHHLARYLREQGYYVRGADLKLPEFEQSWADDFLCVDLRDPVSCIRACEGIDEVYHLAADMGGIGYITSVHASVCRNNTSINLNMLEAARLTGVARFLFSSTACVYPVHLQDTADAISLSEDHAYPANPEEGYGWEKLYMEKLCEYYREDFKLDCRIVRFHNVYGPCGAYCGGKEKAPAAVCRKVASAAEGETIEIWGDGEQTRSFLYVDDCVEGVHRLMRSSYTQPLNLGSDKPVSINELYSIVAGIAKKDLVLSHDLTKPQGVRGRNSDNTRLRSVLGWEPQSTLFEGLDKTYRWIESQIQKVQTLPETDLPHASATNRMRPTSEVAVFERLAALEADNRQLRQLLCHVAKAGNEPAPIALEAEDLETTSDEARLPFTNA